MLRRPLQETRAIAISDLLGPNELVLRRFQGREGLSQLFAFDLELLSTNNDIDGRQLLDRDVTVRIELDEQSCRYFHGRIASFSYCGESSLMTVYRATVVPWLWLLGQTADCRIFQHQTTPQILEQIFKQYGLHDFDMSRLRGTYRPRDYCVQYRETDLAFVSRLMEEEGIFYYFRHEEGRHTLMLADDVTAYTPIADADVEMADPDSTGDLNDQVFQWEHGRRLIPGRFTERDYSYQAPRTRLNSSEPAKSMLRGQSSLEVYDYPGRFEDRGRGDALTRLRAEAAEAEQDLVRGKATYRSFMPAGRFTVRKHLSPIEVGRSYALIEVEYEASANGTYATGTGTDETNFECRFTCIPADTPFRPQRTTPRPIVEGPQTAVVVGPRGEEIYTDELGRVKVHFHWDREGDWNESDSCWLRVTQTHAGAGWGTMDVPRIGEEVIVKFLEGDPDRPLITGRVYHAESMAPFGLPAEMTRSGMKSNTHKGSGYNEISMDDTAGQEQMRVNAQHNMDSTVGNSQTSAVAADRSADIGNNDTLTIGVDGLTNIANDSATKVGVDATYDVGNHLVIESGTSITLQCGASTLHMNQAGVITISGQVITSAAAAAQNIVAPMTSIVGTKSLIQAGLVNMMLGGIAKISGKESSEVGGAKVDVNGGTVVVRGAPIKLGEVGAPLAQIPSTPKPVNQASVASPDAPQSTATESSPGGDTPPQDEPTAETEGVANEAPPQSEGDMSGPTASEESSASEPQPGAESATSQPTTSNEGADSETAETATTQESMFADSSENPSASSSEAASENSQECMTKIGTTKLKDGTEIPVYSDPNLDDDSNGYARTMEDGSSYIGVGPHTSKYQDCVIEHEKTHIELQQQGEMNGIKQELEASRVGRDCARTKADSYDMLDREYWDGTRGGYIDYYYQQKSKIGHLQSGGDYTHAHEEGEMPPPPPVCEPGQESKPSRTEPATPRRAEPEPRPYNYPGEETLRNESLPPGPGNVIRH